MPGAKNTAAIAATLEELTKANVSIVNDRDWKLESKAAKAVLPHVASDYQAFWVNLSEKQGLSFSQAMAGIQSLVVESNPDYHEQILNIFSDVDDVAGSAKVEVHVLSTGYFETNVESIREARWRRDGHGVWWLYQHQSVRGISVDHVGL
ncbi:hypothetical protein HII31_12948 [Pseudocercospora fuligena]|uniref:Uncharacterized protein n=1 Tax=Pseudocercospora fuligena TaxID=685502 RepID=A0A8H6R8D2_9PEZI|nr:hypothetical protein HII31_12948 [Pseudocercospora fuligena]